MWPFPLVQLHLPPPLLCNASMMMLLMIHQRQWRNLPLRLSLLRLMLSPLLRCPLQLQLNLPTQLLLLTTPIMMLLMLRLLRRLMMAVLPMPRMLKPMQKLMLVRRRQRMKPTTRSSSNNSKSNSALAPPRWLHCSRFIFSYVLSFLFLRRLHATLSCAVYWSRLYSFFCCVFSNETNALGFVVLSLCLCVSFFLLSLCCLLRLLSPSRCLLLHAQSTCSIAVLHTIFCLV
jgi:hypothetical protein